MAGLLLYGVPSYLLLKDSFMQCYCLGFLHVPLQLLFHEPTEKLYTGLTVLKSTYCTNTEVKLAESSSTWALPQHWVPFSSLEQSRPFFTQQTTGAVTAQYFISAYTLGLLYRQQPTNYLQSIIILCIKSYSQSQELVWYLVYSGMIWLFRPGLSRPGSSFLQRWSHNQNWSE